MFTMGEYLLNTTKQILIVSWVSETLYCKTNSGQLFLQKLILVNLPIRKLCDIITNKSNPKQRAHHDAVNAKIIIIENWIRLRNITASLMVSNLPRYSAHVIDKSREYVSVGNDLWLVSCVELRKLGIMDQQI